MVDMQKSQLTVFFTQNKEKAVAKFNTLGEVEPPNGIGNLQNIKKEQKLFRMDLKAQRTKNMTVVKLTLSSPCEKIGLYGWHR